MSNRTLVMKETKRYCKKKHEIVIIKNLVKKAQKIFMTTAKKICKSKLEINTENYLIKKLIEKENIEEIDTKKCLKKILKKLIEYQ